MNRVCNEAAAPCAAKPAGDRELPCAEPLKETGVVFNIQHFTVHDGPGIRTEIFLKGCYLRCRWCSNPESFEVKPQLGIYPSSCIGIEKCGHCLTACPKAGSGALVVENGKIVGINREVCDNCMECQRVCPTTTLKQWGKSMTVAEVMESILSDRSFYDKSGGGVTISGGESLFQWRFTREILRQCKMQGIHTCVETALHVNKSVLEEILPYADMIITDIKHMDSRIHKENTGADNTLILENIKRIAQSGIPMVLRVPIIPDFNDSREQITQIADFIVNELQNRVVQVQLLRFRRLGEEKYKSLGLPYNMTEVDPERSSFEAHIKSLVKIMCDKGIPAYAGTTHKIQLNEKENEL